MDEYRPVRFECENCGFVKVIETPRTMVECGCENYSYCDSGDGYYTRGGGTDIHLVKISIEGAEP